jgi:hypothetical protein
VSGPDDSYMHQFTSCGAYDASFKFA